jgi:hypothetical protein
MKKNWVWFTIGGVSLVALTIGIIMYVKNKPTKAE